MRFKKFYETQQVDEKLITFANKAYPKSGNLLILAGGAGSGKGFILKELIADLNSDINQLDAKRISSATEIGQYEVQLKNLKKEL